MRRNVRGLLKNQRKQARQILNLVIGRENDASDSCGAIFCQKASGESQAARPPLKIPFLQIHGKEI